MSYEPTEADNEFLTDLSVRAVDAFMDRLEMTPEGQALFAFAKSTDANPLPEALGDFFKVTVEGFSAYAASNRKG